MQVDFLLEAEFTRFYEVDDIAVVVFFVNALFTTKRLKLKMIRNSIQCNFRPIRKNLEAFQKYDFSIDFLFV